MHNEVVGSVLLRFGYMVPRPGLALLREWAVQSQLYTRLHQNICSVFKGTPPSSASILKTGAALTPQRITEKQ